MLGSNFIFPEMNDLVVLVEEEMLFMTGEGKKRVQDRALK